MKLHLDEEQGEYMQVNGLISFWFIFKNIFMCLEEPP